MEDGIIHALLCDGQVAAQVISCCRLVETARILHGTSPCATAALGRTLAGALLMCSRVKNDKEKLSVVIKGGGIAGQIIATVNNAGEAKGYIQNPEADLPLRFDGKLDVGGIVGNTGTITVIRDSGSGEPYVGVAKLVSGEIAEDIAQYYQTSEQQPAAVLLGVLVDRQGQVMNAGGMLLTPLPECRESVLEELERKVYSLAPITELLPKYECLEELLHDCFWDIGVKPLEETSVRYHCDCSRECMLSALASIGRQDLEELAQSAEPIELQCQFCNQKYTFMPQELSDCVNGIKENE